MIGENGTTISILHMIILHMRRQMRNGSRATLMIEGKSSRNILLWFFLHQIFLQTKFFLPLRVMLYYVMLCYVTCSTAKRMSCLTWSSLIFAIVRTIGRPWQIGNWQISKRKIDKPRGFCVAEIQMPQLVFNLHT